MAAGYLYLNAALYFLFAIWCTLMPNSTARHLGYTDLTNGGHSEYLVIYGGLQLGLSIVFFLLAQNPATLRLGVMIAVALYASIVLYRLVTIIRFWPVSSMTIGTGVLEFSLFMGALWILRTR